MSEISIAAEKSCHTCKESFPGTTAYFHRDKARPDGLTTSCKQCRRAWRRDCRRCGTVMYPSGTYDSRANRKIRRREFCSQECTTLFSLGDIGAVFGRLTVLSYAGSGKKEGFPLDRPHVLCRCECGNEKPIAAGNLRAGNVQSCGCLLEEYFAKNRLGGEQHPGWKGGRRTISNGYIVLKRPEHPNAMADGYVLEHVYVMSTFLGRALRKTENVHHRNGVKSDNNLTNLELWTKVQPTGQRVEDMVAFCEAYLKEYRTDARKLAQLRQPADDEQQLSFLPAEVGDLMIDLFDEGELL